MPIRWYGPANPQDPIYRHFERIVNFCLHAGIFAATNSGIWFLQEMKHPFPEPSLAWITGIWASILTIHLINVIAQRQPSRPN
ncbi:hypothetical protein [Synechococcus sp. M16CYN]|uniref:hypothetical protein n=1 Tax=Synechococcus sp. M16CYN TaxID=3103139 RepID=UPI00324CF121